MVKVAVITGSSASGLACMTRLLSKAAAATAASDASSISEQLTVCGCFRRQGKAATFRTALPAEALKNISFYQAHPYVDAQDIDSLRKALEGVDRALLVTPLSVPPSARSKRKAAEAGASGTSMQGDAAMSINMIRAAKEMGVKRIVHIGSWTVNAPDRLPILAARFTPTEEYLETEIGDQMEWTVLRGGYFMSNWANMHAASIGASDQMVAVPDCKIPSVDVRDIGIAAAALLGGDHDDNYASSYHKKYIECCGPQLHTHAEIAAELSAGIGRTISFPNSPPTKLSEWCEQTDKPNPIMLELYKYMAAAEEQSNTTGGGVLPFDPEAFATVLGRQPTQLRQWAADHKHVFGG